MNTRFAKKIGVALLALGLAPLTALTSSIVGSKHDLSLAGGSTYKTVTEKEVCIFCHTPHQATAQTPLWNHAFPTASYIPYASSTTKATIGQPTGASKLCLSCHDGTVALGMVNSRTTPIPMQDGVTTMPLGPSHIGSDLSDDHPVSFDYNNALFIAKSTSLNGQLKDPASLTAPVSLDFAGQMQCTSCHSAHDNQYGKFLVMDNTGSPLCIKCHTIPTWSASTHKTSAKTWNGSGVNPWPSTSYKTVAANACENCHALHTAGTHERILTSSVAENNCYSCHSGNVAAKNVQAEFNKSSIHPIAATTGIHDPAEDPINATRHAACVDCHNPHASNGTTVTTPSPTVPAASGPILGTIGANAAGAVLTPVTAEYQLCFRCHADSPARGPARVTRQFVQTNTRLEFAPANASYHPIEAVGKLAYSPSLISPWTTSSLMKCTDCHNNDGGPGNGGTGPKGPHGSSYTPILERQLLLTDNTAYNAANFAMCYKCHSEASILSDTGFKAHNEHIVGVQATCTTCHDPHGVATAPHLINFNRTYVTPSSSGRLQFIDNGTYQGTCYLTCHGKDHNPLSY